MDILLAHATEYAATFAELGLAGWVPREVEALVFECLAKDPEERPQAARELAERYDTALERAKAKLEAKAAAAATQSKPPGGGSSHVMPGLPVSQQETEASSATPTPVQSAGTRDQAALPFHLEAWMPERIAIMKLRGFVHDAGGEVVESIPGLIKVRLGGRKNSGVGPLSWLGFGRRNAGVIDMELHLRHTHPDEENRLTVHVLFRPSHPQLLGDKLWRARCNHIFIELRAYLMAHIPET
jgi:serine/threonine-protein kinase